MLTKIVTTMGPGSWDLYGRRFVESFVKYWPKDIQLEVWHHDLNGAVPQFDGVTFRCLDDTESFKKISHAHNGGKDGPSLNYSFKAVALASAVTPDLDWIGFIDADVEFMQPVDATLMHALFDAEYHLTYLYRRAVKESEGSWFAFNLRTVEGASLLADFWGLYDSNEVAHYKKAHDNAVLDRLVLLHQAHGLKVRNLSEGALGLDAFHQSPLGAYAIHYKGPGKDKLADPGLMVPGRYKVLCELLTQSITATGRADIVEVGTWNGSRAIQMAEAAFATGIKKVSYVGFDTFQQGNDRAHEGHTKPHANSYIVGKRLENYSRLVARTGREFNWHLVEGNTLETMPGAAAHVANATFAYIDGGHSYETTTSDYNGLKHVPFVVFDDVIAKDEPGAPDGPRRAWEEATGQKQLITSNDGYAGLEQSISFGVVVAPGFAVPQIRTQLVVKPVDSVDKAEQFEHIAENTRAITKWLDNYQAHGQTALLVSAGPTLKDFLEDIRAKQAAGAKVFAVKHAYPVLKDAGITPDFTVMLDPRPVDGVSTHGVLRTELFADLTVGDRFLVATMTHPSARKHIEALGAEVWGWHAHTAGTQKANLPEFRTGLVVGGGTCAATRLPMLAFVMGFRRMEFYGYDFYYDEATDKSQIKQTLMTVGIGKGGQQFLTTGELVAAMQDLGHWVRWMVDNRLGITFHGKGAGAAVWDSLVTDYHPPKDYPFN